MAKKQKTQKSFIWQDRKRTLFGLPWSFTRYFLEDDKLTIDRGFFTRSEDEIRLYRIMDITLRRSLGERIFGLGTVRCISGDKTAPEFELARIKNPKEVKEKLSELVESERDRRRIGVREYMDADDDIDDIDDRD